MHGAGAKRICVLDVIKQSKLFAECEVHFLELCGLRTRTWGPRTMTGTFKLVLGDKDLTRGLEHWIGLHINRYTRNATVAIKSTDGRPTDTRNLSGSCVYCVSRGLNVLNAALNCQHENTKRYTTFLQLLSHAINETYVLVKPGFHYSSWRPDRFPLPVNTGRVDGRAFPLAELTDRQHGPSTRLVETGLKLIVTTPENHVSSDHTTPLTPTLCHSDCKFHQSRLSAWSLADNAYSTLFILLSRPNVHSRLRAIYAICYHYHHHHHRSVYSAPTT